VNPIGNLIDTSKSTHAKFDGPKKGFIKLNLIRQHLLLAFLTVFTVDTNVVCACIYNIFIYIYRLIKAQYVSHFDRLYHNEYRN